MDARDNRIAEFRKKARLSQARLAQAVGTGRSTIVKLERGEMRLTTVWMRRIADQLQVRPSALISDEIPREVEIMGYVGAGTKVYPLDDQMRRQGETVPCPIALDAEKTAAVIVRGDSMLPLEDGWVLYYTRMFEGVPIDAVGHLCVVQLANDGPIYVKQLRRGYAPNHFNLLSTNADPIEDANVEWAARVKLVVARELIR